jgi:hypothetical protein
LRWDLRPRTIKEVIVKPGSPPLYLLDGDVGKRKIEPVGYTKNQLQVIPKNERTPDSSLIHESKRKHVVEKILSKSKIKNKWMYLIKWEDSKEPTYEPVKNITQDVPDIAAKFESSL